MNKIKPLLTILALILMTIGVFLFKNTIKSENIQKGIDLLEKKSTVKPEKLDK